MNPNTNDIYSTKKKKKLRSARQAKLQNSNKRNTNF